MLGLLITGVVSRAALGGTDGLPLLIAPMGASAVLLFAVPSSPLAQPWSILGGNIVAALIGVTSARLVADPMLAAAAGGGLAVLAMMALRCLHPPSGAVALTAVLGGPAVRAAGYHFVLWPVGLNSLLLLAAALAFNNATGRRYPHQPSRNRDTRSETAVATVLHRQDEVIDVGQHDLATLVEEVEVEIAQEKPRVASCADLMRPETQLLPASMPLPDAFDRMCIAQRASLPVIGESERCIGLAEQGQLARHLWSAGRNKPGELLPGGDAVLATVGVGEVISPLRTFVRPETPITVVADAMIAEGTAYFPVLDGDGKVVGAITQADLIRWLARPLRQTGAAALPPGL